jgi:hypothetical protein
MDTGRFLPSPSPVNAAFEDPLHQVALGDQLWWYMCADIKIDAFRGSLSYQFASPRDVDYIAFETKLQHLNAVRGNLDRIYVQIHNRGIRQASNVTVKILLLHLRGYQIYRQIFGQHFQEILLTFQTESQ